MKDMTAVLRSTGGAVGANRGTTRANRMMVPRTRGAFRRNGARVRRNVEAVGPTVGPMRRSEPWKARDVGAERRDVRPLRRTRPRMRRNLLAFGRSVAGVRRNLPSFGRTVQRASGRTGVMSFMNAFRSGVPGRRTSGTFRDGEVEGARPHLDPGFAFFLLVKADKPRKCG
jgi:hypothetical protein